MTIKFKKPTCPMFLFSLPFLSVGLGMLIISIIPTLYLAVTVPNWDRVPAMIETTNLETSYGDSTTYQVVARYRYQHNGQVYVNERVGFSRGSDNIGNWHSNAHNKLNAAMRSNEPIMAFVHPKHSEKSYLFPDLRWGLFGLKMIFVVVFGGVGGFLCVASAVQFRDPSSPDSASKARWKSTTQSDHIYSTTRKVFWGYLLIGLFTAAVSSPALFAIVEEWQQGNKLILLALIFPLIALGFLQAAFKEGLRILKFGRSPLVMRPYPATVGGHFGATVQVKVPYEKDQKYRVTLNCIKRVTTRSGGKSRTSEHTVWNNEGFAYVERDTNGTTLLKIAFNLPSSVAESSTPSQNYHFWRLDINANLSGSVFKRSFKVLVQKAANAAPTQQYLADQHPLMDDLIDDRVALLNIQQQGNNLTYSIPRFAYPLERLGGIVFGSIFVASGVGVSMAGAPFIFPLVFVPIGSLIAFSSLKSLLTSTKITLSPTSIRSKTSTMGIFKKQREVLVEDFSSFKISDASTWKNAQGPSRHFYKIIAHDIQSNKLIVIDRVEGRDSAEALCDRFNKFIQVDNV